MTDQVLDPEKAMQRDLEKKRAVATQTIQFIKTEFVREYLEDFGELPDLTNPMINMFYNGWLAAQGDRKWHTPAEINEMKRRQIQNEQRRQTMMSNKAKRKGLR